MSRIPKASIEFAKAMRQSLLRYAHLTLRVRKLQKRAALMDSKGLSPDAIVDALVDLNLRLRDICTEIGSNKQVRGCPHISRLLDKLGSNDKLLWQFLKGPPNG